VFPREQLHELTVRLVEGTLGVALWERGVETFSRFGAGRSRVDRQAFAMDAMEVSQKRKREDERVKFNVQGTRFETALSTLRSVPESLLAKMFDERYAPPDAEEVWFDMNPEHFRKILAFLTACARGHDSLFDFRPVLEDDLLRAEFVYFNLPLPEPIPPTRTRSEPAGAWEDVKLRDGASCELTFGPRGEMAFARDEAYFVYHSPTAASPAHELRYDFTHLPRFGSCFVDPGVTLYCDFARPFWELRRFDSALKRDEIVPGSKMIGTSMLVAAGSNVFALNRDSSLWVVNLRMSISPTEIARGIKMLIPLRDSVLALNEKSAKIVSGTWVEQRMFVHHATECPNFSWNSFADKVCRSEKIIAIWNVDSLRCYDYTDDAVSVSWTLELARPPLDVAVCGDTVYIVYRDEIHARKQFQSDPVVYLNTAGIERLAVRGKRWLYSSNRGTYLRTWK